MLTPPPRSPEDFLLRILLFTADPTLGDTPAWRELACSDGVDAVGLSLPRRANDGALRVVALTAGAAADRALAGLVAGELVSAGALADAIEVWSPAFVVVVGDVEVPAELCARSTTWRLTHGWVGRGKGILGVAAVVAELRSLPNAAGTEAALVARAAAPAYEDDALTDLERRGRELSFALLRETLQRCAHQAPAPLADTAAMRRWPSGTARAWAAATLGLRRLTRRLGQPSWVIKTVAAAGALALVAPARALWRTVRRRHPVHIFTFHRVSELCRDGMTVRPEVFRRQLAAIQRSHRMVTMDEAISLVRSAARLARPVAVITFDDAYISVATTAAPILARVGVPACCFVSTGVIGPEGRFVHDRDSPLRELLAVSRWEELDGLRSAGWMLGAHTATHARLALCEPGALWRELAEPLETLRARYRDAAIPFAYPFGGERDITPVARELVAMLGYSACLSDFGGENHPACEPWSMRRIELGGDHAALAWRVRVRGMDLGSWRPRWLRPSRGPGVVHAA